MHLNGQLSSVLIPVVQLKPVQCDRSGFQLHHFATAGPGVSPFAVDMHSRYLGGALLNRATKRSQSLIEFGFAETGPIMLRQRFTLQVVGAGALPQLNHSAVSLVSGQVGQQPCCGPQSDRQNTGYGRVEGAAMAHASKPIATAQTSDTAVGGQSGWLVDHHKAEGAVHRGRSS